MAQIFAIYNRCSHSKLTDGQWVIKYCFMRGVHVIGIYQLIKAQTRKSSPIVCKSKAILYLDLSDDSFFFFFNPKTKFIVLHMALEYTGMYWSWAPLLTNFLKISDVAVQSLHCIANFANQFLGNKPVLFFFVCQ